MVRLKDIAAKAGVSVMTVSKVIRDAPDISDATKVRIRRLAAEMGYTPNNIAQCLRNRRTFFLGLVIPAATDPVCARILLGVEEYAHQAGYDILLAHSLHDPDREEQNIRRLLSRKIDGLLVAPVYRHCQTVPLYEELFRSGLPTVLLGHPAPFCAHFASVSSDDVTASYHMTRHLLSLKHQRIAFFTGSPAMPSSQERLEGYQRALREAGIEPDDRLVFAAGNTTDAGEKAALQFLDEAPQATAIQAANDLVAIGAANVLRSRGIRIPEQLSIAGFGNVFASEFCFVPLTSVREPKLRLGQAAMVAMTQIFEGKLPGTVRLPAELVIRQSTGPASDSGQLRS